jgi:hypothetical protein
MEEAMEAPLVPFVGDPGRTTTASALDADADGDGADLRRRLDALQAQLDRIEARIEGR